MDTLIAPVRAHAERRLLGRYRLLERLGEGGFGVVWRAHDEQLRREVALKRIALPPPARDDARAPRQPGAVERAQREAQAAARLSHPAIVALYEAQAEGDCFYLVSELVHGATLAQLIAERAIEPQRAAQVGVAIAGALEHAHARGVIHRDVKPHNILVPHEPHRRAAIAKLTDFGGATLAGADALTRTDEVLGTLAYMSPEQSEGREAGEPSDLYSLALVLYETLAGANPVRGSTPAATARRIGRPVPPLTHRRPDLPHELTHAIDRALAPSPPQRGTLAELRMALEDAVHAGLHAPRPARGGRWERAERSERGELEEPADRTELAEREDPADPADPADHDDAERPASPLRARLQLPRVVWLGLGVALAVWLAARGLPGAGLLVLAATAPLLALPRRAGPGWMAAALAPALGVVGLAGAYPALAAQAGRWRARAALGALGYWWLCLAEPLVGRRLWLGATGVPARARWEGSLEVAAAHVLGGVLTLGVLGGAALWAVGAAVLPCIVRGRSALLDIGAVSIWSAALIAAAPTLGHGPPFALAHPSPRGAAVGAVLGALLAVAARALRGPV